MRSPRARRLLVALAVLVPLVAAAVAASAVARVHAGPRARGPRSVVLFVGDGMGVAHVTLGRLAAERAKRPYAFDRFPVVGFADTRSANCVVTDSAAAATAFSAGYKTNNTFLGVDPEKRPRRTVLELAHHAGMKTGLVSTARLTDATPAAFATHVPDRHTESDIADQLRERRRGRAPRWREPLLRGPAPRPLRRRGLRRRDERGRVSRLEAGGEAPRRLHARPHGLRDRPRPRAGALAPRDDGQGARPPLEGRDGVLPHGRGRPDRPRGAPARRGPL